MDAISESEVEEIWFRLSKFFTKQDLIGVRNERDFRRLLSSALPSIKRGRDYSKNKTNMVRWAFRILTKNKVFIGSYDRRQLVKKGGKLVRKVIAIPAHFRKKVRIYE